MKLLGQRWFEVGFWVALVLVITTVNATSVLIEHDRNNVSVELWEPFVWEYTSGVFLLMLVPVIIGFEHRFPLVEQQWRRSLAAHLAFSVPVSLIHVGGMVALRKLIYLSIGGNYDFGNLPIELLYEYRKDALDYALVLGILYSYRFARARRGGEASAVAEGSGAGAPPAFTVRRGQEEFSVPVADINWVEAAGNYALLHTSRGAFAIRETMKDLAERLSPHGFERCHRSSIVNLAKITSTRPTRHGDAEIFLEDGGKLRMGRNFRAAIDARRAGPV